MRSKRRTRSRLEHIKGTDTVFGELIQSETYGWLHEDNDDCSRLKLVFVHPLFIYYVNVGVVEGTRRFKSQLTLL